jgi:hypothetical protein
MFRNVETPSDDMPADDWFLMSVLAGSASAIHQESIV